MIIGLVGKRGVGKDVVGAYLVKKHSFERKAFADPLKRSVAVLFNIPFEDVDKHKLNSSVIVSVASADYHAGENLHFVNYSSMTFREFLQRYGTESHRGTFGDDFWTDQCLPVGGFYAGRAIVITDCRFINEAERIKELGGIIVKVERAAAVDKNPHSSETQLEQIEPDWLLVNDYSIEELYSQIESMLANVNKQ